MNPIIGITTYGRYESKLSTTHYDEHFLLPAQYVDAVRRAGGVPVLLPPGEPNWHDWLRVVDGVIISGGSDIHPSQYDGDSEHPNLTVIDHQRDETELALARHLAQKEQRPTLCICRGMQVLNVALGGSMSEHLPDILPEDIHRGADGGWTVQPLQADPATLLAKVMGTTDVATYSGHHQAVKKVAPSLQITATAEDGVVEALGDAAHPWLIAVQWHPEVSAERDETQQRLFDELVAKCRLNQLSVEIGAS